MTNIALPVASAATDARAAAKRGARRERGRGFYIYLSAGTALALVFVLPLAVGDRAFPGAAAPHRPAAHGSRLHAHDRVQLFDLVGLH